MIERTTHYETFHRYALFRSRWLSVYFHRYFADRLLPFHDHPWWNVSVRIRGAVQERIIADFMSLDRGKPIDVSSRRVVFRKATTAHEMRAELGAWSLFITGPEWNVVGGRA